MMSMATGTTISQHMMIAATGMVPSHTPRTHTPPSGTLNGRVSSGRVERSQMRLRHTIEKATPVPRLDRKSTRLNSSHSQISYAVFCLKKKKRKQNKTYTNREQQQRHKLQCHLVILQ